MNSARIRKTARRALYAAAFAIEACAAAWIAAPLFADDPVEEFARRPETLRLEYRDGSFMKWLRPDDLSCRVPVPLSTISSNAVAAILSVEDADFREHGAVDWAAAARALWQNAVSMRIVSGASTISMQTAAMLRKNGRHSLWGKFMQIARARRMEYLHSKDEILEAYLNNIPYGGKIEGIEAASRHYFGVSANDITQAEAAFLAGIPQRPNRYRPDRHPEAALARYRTACGLVERAGLVADPPDPRSPPPLRDFRTTPPFARERGARERAHPVRILEEAAKRAKAEGRAIPRSSLDIKLCEDVDSILRAACAKARGVRDAAAVVIDNATGEVVAYTGTLDFDSPLSGQVDAARAVRSAGSTLKPFFYAEAVSGGLIAGDTMLDDSPVRYRAYAPLNFSRKWSGRVPAREALSQSLNIPAVALVAELGEKRVLSALARFGLNTKLTADIGLSVAFGTGGHTLLDLAFAYSALATGKLRKPVWTIPAEAAAEPEEVVSGPVRAAVAEMLRSRKLPDGPRGTAWKTGTSNNLRDAWCIAYTPKWTVAVWFGNKNGERSESLVGAEIAAPAAGAIVSRVRGPDPVEGWNDCDLEETPICAESGLAPSARCKDLRRGKTPRGIPLRLCAESHEAAAKAAHARPLILAPKPVEYKIEPGEEAVRLRLESSEPETMFLADGIPASGVVPFTEGLHCVEAVSPARREKLFFSVAR